MDHHSTQPTKQHRHQQTEPADTPVYEVGVLFVHGIGVHTKGQAVLQFGQSLMAGLDAWISENPADINRLLSISRLKHISVDKACVTPFSDDPAAPPNVALSINNISQIRQSSNQAQKPAQWLLAESAWDETYPVPTFRDLWLWGVDGLPWTLISHFDTRLRRIEYQIKDAANQKDLWWNLLRWVWEHTSIVLGLLLVPLLVISLLLLLLIGSIPVPSLQPLVAAWQRRIARSVGDSYVLVGNDLSGAVIYERMRRDLVWLCERASHVAVIAHSQGAAIAHRVIYQSHHSCTDVEKLKLFVTVGQGLRKLTELQSPKDGRKQFRPIWGASTTMVAGAVCLLLFLGNSACGSGLPCDFPHFRQSLLVIGLLLFAFLLRSLHLRSVLAASKALGWINKLLIPLFMLFLLGDVLMAYFTLSPAFGTWVLLAGAAFSLELAQRFLRMWEAAAGKSLAPQEQNERDKKEYEETYAFNHMSLQQIHWYNFFAARDSVSNGPLLDYYEPTARFVQRQVTNRDSLLLDHTTYADNYEGVIFPIVQALAALPQHKPPTAPELNKNLESAWDSRQRRINLLSVGHWILFVFPLVTILVMLGNWLFCPSEFSCAPNLVIGYIQNLLRSVQDFAGQLLALLPGSSLDGNQTALGLGTILVILMIYMLASLAWSQLWWLIWERQGVRAFFLSQPRRTA